MTRLAHVSDLHVLDLGGVPLVRLLNKRLTGLANLALARRGRHSALIAERLVAELQRMIEAGIVDHVIVTGDTTNLSLEPEFARARAILAPLATPARLSLVPGNHDVYTRGAAREGRFEEAFGSLLWPDGPPAGEVRYPWFKTVGDLELAGLCSVGPRAPLMADGLVTTDQLERLEAWAAGLSGSGRALVVALHHNLHDRGPRRNAMHGLRHRREVLARCQRAGVSAVVHGHTHRALRFEFRGLWVLGCPSSTATTSQPGRAAGFEVIVTEGRHVVAVETYTYEAASQRFLRRDASS